MKIKGNKKGFTLVELLAVIVVLAIIMIIAIWVIYKKKTKEIYNALTSALEKEMD